MSQWSHAHPELCEEGVTAYDWYAERIDMARKERREDEEASMADHRPDHEGRHPLIPLRTLPRSMG